MNLPDNPSTTMKRTPSTPKLTGKDLVVPALLILLSVVPMIGGAMRLNSLSAPPTEENARFLISPVPVLLHIPAASLYAVLGAFQFSSWFRRRFPAWHRGAGKVLGVAGLVTGVTGMWMAHVYSIPTGLQGPLLHVVRLVVGAAMIASLLIGWYAIVRRDVPRHEAWMIRAYALGQAAGTQVVVLGPWMALTGQGTGLPRDILMTFTWILNLAVAEWLIRRRQPDARGRMIPAAASSSGSFPRLAR